MTRRKLFAWVAGIVVLAGFAMTGCDELTNQCEDRCVGSQSMWLDDCEDCAVGILTENDCADIWCE